MSHLSTIIHRVNRRLNEVYNGDDKKAAGDSLWLQSVRNLKEYQESWRDQTSVEVAVANELYQNYSKYLKLTKGITIRANIDPDLLDVLIQEIILRKATELNGFTIIITDIREDEDG